MGTFLPHLEILPTPQRKLWPRLREVPRWFTLYGGTALALRLGHRTSVDFDFFTSEPFTEAELRALIPFAGDAQVAQRGDNTLSLMLPEFDDVRVSFFGGLTVSRVSEPELDDQDTILVASLDDVAAMKLAVITQRAATRDYCDLAAILRAGLSLGYALGCAKAVYRHEFDPMLGLKALIYFDDLPSLPKDTADFLAAAAASVREIPEVPITASRITPESCRKLPKP
ncbi:MAG: nucleotidyl transferase AbiEii/AbiGii toxin family protein [Verrucomicrobiales bacterium]